MRFLSLFSGIEAASVAWNSLGWICAAVAEIEKFPCSVLKHHYAHVPNLGDVTKITQDVVAGLGKLNVVIFGFPCQDLSVAGKRAGLRDKEGEVTRSGLFFDAMRIVRWSGARWAVAENVPGIFSSNEGLDFAAVVGEMAGVRVDVPDGGWQNSGFLVGPDGLVEWAVLDAQFFGVPQRRRRVFIVRDTGDWRSRPPLLLESSSLSGNPPPRRETGKGFTHDIAPSLIDSGRGTELTGDSRGQDPVVAVDWPAEITGTLGADFASKWGLDDQHIGGGVLSSSTGPISHCLNAGGMGRQDFETETLISVGGFPSSDITHALRGEGFDASEDGTGRGTPLVPIAFSCKDYGADVGDISPTLRSMGHADSHANAGGQVAVGFEIEDSKRSRQDGVGNSAYAVRRLTPEECESLMEFPRGYTKINAKSADGPRYKALGNSMHTGTIRWIGERIELVDRMSR